MRPPMAITIRPVADEGTIKFNPPSVTIDGWQLAVGGGATLEEATFGLELSTTIVMTPVGEPCQRGCPGRGWRPSL